MANRNASTAIVRRGTLGVFKRGVGTAAPTAKLDLRGSDGYLKFDSSASDATIKSDYNLKLYGDDTGNNSSGYQNIQFYTAGANERMRIDSAGNVGIGTTAPGFALQVEEGTTATYAASIRNANDNLQLKLGTTTGALLNIQGSTISTDAAYNISLQADGGNVGIGVVSPDSRLEIKGAGASTGLTLKTTDSSGNTGFWAMDGGRVGVHYYPFLINQDHNDSNYPSACLMYAHSASPFTIKTDGNVGIGTTAPGAKLMVGSPTRQAGTATQTQAGYFIGTKSAYYSAAYKGMWQNQLHVADDSALAAGIGGAITFGATQDNTNGTFLASIEGSRDDATSGNYGGSMIFRTRTNGATLMGAHMVISSVGNVGIGTTAPDSKLEIVGGGYNSSLKIKGSGSHTGIQFEDSGGTTDGYVYAAGLSVGLLDAGTDWMIQCENDNFIRFATNGNTEHMRITSVGNVGIGTTSPRQSLQVGAIDTANDGVRVTNAGSLNNKSVLGFGGSYIQPMAAVGGVVESAVGFTAGGLYFSTRTATSDTVPTERMRITSDGNVGIGTTAPGKKLDVVGETRIQSSSSSATHLNYNDAGTNYISTSDTSATYFRGVSSTTMTVKGDGKVGIGTAAPTSNLHVSGSAASANYAATISNDSGGGRVLKLYNHDWDVADYLIYASNGGTPSLPHFKFVVDGNARVGIGTDTPYYKLHTEFTDNTTVLSGGSGGNWGGNGIRIDNNSTTVGSMAIAHFRTYSADWHIGNRFISSGPDKSDFFFKHETTEVLTILNDGKVGIGTTAPERSLHVVGGIHMNNGSSLSWDQAGGDLRNAIRVDSGDDLNIGDTNFDDIYFSTGQKTNCVSIKQTTGNFGIGTTAPSYLLDVNGTARLGALTGTTATFSGYISQGTGQSHYFRGGTDANWRIGSDITTDTGGLVTGAAVQMIVGGWGNTYGFQIFGHATPTSPCFEVIPNTTVATSVTNVRGKLYINNTQVIDNSRNLSNIVAITTSGTITSGANLVSTGHLSSSAVYNSGNYKILNNGGTAWHDVVTRGSGDNYTINALGGFNIGSTTVIDASRNLTNIGTITTAGGVTVGGDLTINGTTTTVNTTNLLVDDPLMLLARVQTGTPTLDCGLIMERGTGTNVGMIWDESADQFAFINTTDTASTAGNVVIASYAPLQTAALTGTSATFSGSLKAGTGTLTANSQNDVALFSANGTAAQSGNFYNKLKLFGGDAQARDLQLWQQYDEYAHIGSMWTSNKLYIDSSFLEFTVNTNFRAQSCSSQTITADESANITFFGTGDLAQGGAYYSKLKIKGGGGQTRDLQLWQEDSGYSHIGTSWTNNNQLHIDDFAGLYVNTAITTTGQVTATAGAVASPSYSFIGDTNTGISRPTTDAVNIVTAGAERMRITSVGNVGIGTTAPSSKLHVTAAPANGVYLSYLYNSATHAAAHGLNVQVASTGTAAYALRVNTGSDTNALAVMGSGKVGIGTSAPSTKLQVNDTSDSRLLIYETGASPYTATLELASQAVGTYGALVQYTSGAERLTLQNYGRTVSGQSHGSIAFKTKLNNTTPTEVMFINGFTGKVGIGTTAPTVPLDVYGAGWGGIDIDGASGGELRFQKAGSTYGQIFASNTHGLVINAQGGLGDIFFQSSGTTKMTLLDSGTLNVGSPNTSSSILSVYEATDHHNAAGKPSSTINVGAFALAANEGPTIDFNLRWSGSYEATSTTTGWIGGRIGSVYDASSGNGGALVFYTNHGTSASGGPNSSQVTEKVRINPAGNVGIGTTAPGAKLEIDAGGTTDILLGVISNSTTYNAISLNGNMVDAGKLGLAGGGSGNTNLYVDVPSTGEHVFRVATVQKVVFDASGKVGIGTTAPIEKLQVVGQLISTSSNSTSATTGAERAIMDLSGYTATDHSARFGHFRGATAAGAGQLRLYTDSVERIRIDASGKVGIGTTAPSANLHIKQGGDFTGSGGALLHIGTSVITNTSDLGLMVSVNDATTTAPQKAGLILYNNNATAGGWSPMLLFSKKESGASPYQATMAGIAAKAPLGTGNGGAWIDGELHFYTAGAATSGMVPRMVINSSGNVGIGTIAPAYDLQVAGNIDATRLYVNAGGNATDPIIRVQSDTNTGIFFPADDTIAWTTGGSERMRIKSDGNVGIGTSAPIANLDVDLNQTNVALSGDNAAHFGGQHHASGQIMGITLGYREANTNYRKIGLVAEGLGDNAARQNFHILVDSVNDGGSAQLSDKKFTIYGLTGHAKVWNDLTVGGTITESSSIAIKENIFDFNTTLDKISRVRPVVYNKKINKNKKEIGFIAEELAEIFPELVENDEKGNPTSVNYTRAVTVLFDGFKQMYKELKEIKERIK
jgi:fibronectin-binding autotransporter adhesin